LDPHQRKKRQDLKDELEKVWKVEEIRARQDLEIETLKNEIKIHPTSLLWLTRGRGKNVFLISLMGIPF
jgi:hypothetical protein